MIRARESKSAPVGVVRKVLMILETLDRSESGLQLGQIAEITRLNKSTAYRFLAHLESEDYLYRDDTGVYVVGPKLARLGSGLAYHAALRRISRPVLLSVATSTKETVNLGLLEGAEVLYLDVVESAHTFRMVSRPGMRRPVNCTALGKAILAFLPEHEREDLFSTLSFERFTPHTIRNLTRLRKELAVVARQGYAVDDEETYLGARCAAAPIFDGGAKVLAAISVSGPLTRISTDALRTITGTVRQAARRISQSLGHNHSGARTKK
jgi:DNA-binding IclR family transcriptional regulator